MKEQTEKHKKLRLTTIAFFLFGFFLAAIGRLYFLQVVEHERYTDYSKKQYYQKVQIGQTRGKILDRNKMPMAITVPVKSVFAHPYKVENLLETAAIIASELKLGRKAVLNKISGDKNFVWLKRKITDEEYVSLKAKRLEGIFFLSEDKRFYPHETLASRAIGFTGIDNQGLAGLEYRYDKLLLGEKATYIAKKDALGRIYGYTDGQGPNNSFEMITTIDSRIQYAVEKALRASFEKYQAKSAVVIVMDTKTGEILALAEEPEFNPNKFSDYGVERYKAISVTESFEPGSTFKVFLAAAALDSGAASPDEIFNCENGKLSMGEYSIREADNNSYGELTFKEIISKSSNIGSIKIGWKIGEERFYDYITRFGFGSKTGVDLPGEAPGLFQSVKNWSETSLPSMSFGQEVMVTPIQLVTALSVIGNSGMSVHPHFMKEITQNGKTIRKYKAPPSRRIISEKAARQTVEMMRLSVTDGTSRRAFTPGYDLAGKTGTAQKYDVEAKQYSKDKHLASFIALFPASDPKISILVMMDEPTGKGWGGHVAAPIGKEVAISTARTLGMPSSNDTRYVVDWNELERKYLEKRKLKVQKRAGLLEDIENFIASKATAYEGD